jgi:quercetin dioxygenase-like cupin family protein
MNDHNPTPRVNIAGVFQATNPTRLNRRRFLEVLSAAAIALPLKGSFAMQTVMQEKATSATIVTPEEAQVYNMLGGGEARLLMTGERTNGEWWMGRFREDPGFMTQLHYHPNTDEQVYVLEGTLSVYADDKWHELGPGTLGTLPRGKPHAQGNRSDKPVHFIGSGAPSGFENLFPAVDDLMRRMKPGTPEFIAEFKKIAARCDIVQLGPAPK